MAIEFAPWFQQIAVCSLTLHLGSFLHNLHASVNWHVVLKTTEAAFLNRKWPWLKHREQRNKSIKSSKTGACRHLLEKMPRGHARPFSLNRCTFVLTCFKMTLRTCQRCWCLTQFTLPGAMRNQLCFSMLQNCHICKTVIAMQTLIFDVVFVTNFNTFGCHWTLLVQWCKMSSDPGQSALHAWSKRCLFR